MQILVDSGAMCTLVHHKVLRDKNVSINPTTKVLTGVTGTALSVLGEADVPLSINGECFEHKCLIVRDMDYSMLMGYDMLTARGYVLDFSNTGKSDSAKYTACLSLNHITKISGRCRKVLQLHPSRRLDRCTEAWVTPVRSPQQGVWIEEAISPIDAEGRITVCIINENSYSITLNRRARVATVESYAESRINHVNLTGWEGVSGQQYPLGREWPQAAKSVGKTTRAGPAPKETIARQNEVLRNIDLKALSTSQQDIIRRLVAKEQMVFALDGETLPVTPLIQCNVPTGDTRPIRQRAYRLPECQREPLRQLLTKQIQEGIIRPSNSEWSAPMILVPKKETGSLRPVVDYRSLNDVIRKDNYPLPRIDDLLDRLQGSKVFSVMDLKSGYHQVRVNPRDAHKTAFVCCEGLFEYDRMPMGLATSPPVFQRLLEIVFADMRGKGLLLYIDDIILYTKDECEHEVLLGKVLERLREAGLSLKPSKCHFFRVNVEYLGHEISAKGIYPNRGNIKKVLTYPTPTTLKQLRRFVGMATYYRRFIRNFSQYSKPLTELTKKSRGFSWTPAEQKAFDILKGKLIKAPILAYPRSDCLYILYTDASNHCIGAVLSQIQDETEKVIAYGSRMLTSAEEGYSTTEKECLGVVHFVREYRHYLLGRRFTIVSDHRPLVWLKNMREPTGRLGRWALKLSEFDYEIKYRAGRKNENADALSRLTTANVAVGEMGEEDIVLEEPNLEGELSVAKIKMAQHRDEFCHHMNSYLRRQELPPTNDKLARRIVLEAGRYVLRGDGVLTVVTDSKMPIARVMGTGPVIVLPIKLRSTAMELLHDHLTAGHLGFTKTLRKIQERFYWEGMYTDVERHTKGCVSCSRVKNASYCQKSAAWAVH